MKTENFVALAAAEVAAAAINGEPSALEAEIPANAVVMLVTPVGGG